MTTYICKIPNEVNAIQFNGSNHAEVSIFTNRSVVPISKDSIILKDLDLDIFVENGDYVVRGPVRPYAIHPYIFEKVYKSKRVMSR